eukprot:COSAG01_NODE_27875_length_674_cov_2.417391_2_plen_165_part_01
MPSCQHLTPRACAPRPQSLGYKSVIIPISLLAVVAFISFSLCDMYGVALAALGMISTLSCCLSIDVYGPVCDNAGGVAEMAELDEKVRDCTDALDAAGNTTAAIGKGFAIGSATLVGLALFGAFVTRAGLTEEEPNRSDPIPATSPTLSPTLSAIVAGFRGSSSG